MNKINALLNKVDFFEKLAIHGSRHGALKALAEVSSVMTADIIKAKELLIKVIGESNTKSNNDSLINQIKNSSTTHDLISHFNEVFDLVGKNSPVESKAVDNIMTEAYSLLSKYKNTPIPIGIDTQNKLREFAIKNHLIQSSQSLLDNTNDGKMGPTTKMVIRKIRDYLNSKGNSIMNTIEGDQQIFALVNNPDSFNKHNHKITL